MRNPSFKQECIKALKTLKNAEDPDSNLAYTYRNAIKIITAHSIPLNSLNDVCSIVGVGNFVIKKLETALQKGEPDSDDSLSSDRASTPSSIMKSGAVLVQAPKSRIPDDLHPRMGVIGCQGFCFRYLNHSFKPVDTPRDAFLDVSESVGFRIEYSSVCVHPHIQRITASTTVSITTKRGILPEDLEAIYPHSTWAPAPTRAIKRSPDLTRPLDDEYIAKKCISSIDPSRSSVYSKSISPAATMSTSTKITTAVAGSSVKHISLSEARHAHSLSGSITMPQTPFQDVVDPSKSSQTLKKVIPTRHPAPQRSRPRHSHVIEPPAPWEINVEEPYASSDAFTFPQFLPIIIPPGMFDVVLLLDIREKAGYNHSSTILEKLHARGIKAELRSLDIGDVCWTAQVRDKRSVPQGCHEIVLDAILERKRMDDLCSSIKDGRFHEQKFRLCQTGLTRIFYVVEKFGNSNLDFELQVNTALSSTQIVDGFMVFETSNVDSTVRYYETLHNEVRRRYLNESLNVLPSNVIRRHNYLRFQTELQKRYSSKAFLTTYADFQKLNTKSGSVSVRDVWAKMLLTVNGMSPEKVGRVIEQYSTPRSLVYAFREAEEEERQQREDNEARKASLIGALDSQSKGRIRGKVKINNAKHMLAHSELCRNRPIGPKLSEGIYDLLMRKGRYPTRANEDI